MKKKLKKRAAEHRTEIWVEGFRLNGASGAARLIATMPVGTLDRAVRAYVNHLVASEQREWKHDTLGWSRWGCRVFDNEAAARRMYG